MCSRTTHGRSARSPTQVPLPRKKYQVIFFDWDGTAVPYRTAPVDRVQPLMKALLEQGTTLVIISGTTYEKIAEGELHKHFDPALLANLYLGLGRGAHNYGFQNGEPVLLQDNQLDCDTLLRVHKLAFEFHRYMLRDYDYPTDIVFSRPNYCKVDLLVTRDRGEKMHLSQSEITSVTQLLLQHGYKNGLEGLLADTRRLGDEMDLPVKPTTDAKYLEIGLTTKADNADFFFDRLVTRDNVPAQACSFWGDELGFLAEGVRGSDALTITEQTCGADFFDVSDSALQLPSNVSRVGGGVDAFLTFLEQQAAK